MQETHIELQKNGELKATIERKLLMLLFNGFSSIKFLNKDTSEILALRDICQLSEYTDLALRHNDYGHKKLNEDAKCCFDTLLALDALKDRGLVEKESFFTDEYDPEDGPIHLEHNFLQYTNAWNLSWFANALVTNDVKEYTLIVDTTESSPPKKFSFDYLKYQLTSKGYDVALKFQEHDDAEKRYSQQQALATIATNAANSSSKTAKLALFAASAIAIGSLGNLILSAYIKFCVT